MSYLIWLWGPQTWNDKLERLSKIIKLISKVSILLYANKARFYTKFTLFWYSILVQDLDSKNIKESCSNGLVFEKG